MLYLYDNAIVEDLEKSFNPDHTDNPVVRVVSPEQIIGIAAQIKEDTISLPMVTLERNDSIGVDESLVNFTRKLKGVEAVFDTDTNNIWKERALPIKLSYTLSVFTSNQADMDEIVREILFKYLSMYFLSIRIPYEGDRDISFGIAMNQDAGIQKQSGVSEYTSSGQLYQSSIILDCQGCVLIHYTPTHLKRGVLELDVK